eukprot:2799661-Amphidinium_carterae.1
MSCSLLPPREIRYKISGDAEELEIYMRSRNLPVMQTRPESSLSGMLARPRYNVISAMGGASAALNPFGTAASLEGVLDTPTVRAVEAGE